MNERKLICRAKALVESLGLVNPDKIPFCTNSTSWQINRFYGKNIEKKEMREKLRQHFGGYGSIEHGHYTLQRLDENSCIVYGNFRVLLRNHASGYYGFPYEVTVIMRSGIAQRIILYGDHEECICCIVQSDEDHIYMIKESDILYIESSRNNLIWHCRDMTVSSRGTLKEQEKILAGCFYRIQRGCIINVNHIRSMEKREISMDNGDILLIPYRTCCNVKKIILSKCRNESLISKKEALYG